ncbi:hypothetical protein BOTBODRAFT_440799 [Botryobasidium botryosum FD-172 SS1]|uniref:Uncharacterized protein n=1 Tax=Botryobasidium botryosum (strain FD-172 SS1) TaxID=930990 RepID=A0A067MUR8_BOTB1|nr:hypothetical protein BOTBODRAFT_440799 [Botryobasidium botryosum FD-172 SS1]
MTTLSISRKTYRFVQLGWPRLYQVSSAYLGCSHCTTRQLMSFSGKRVFVPVRTERDRTRYVRASTLLLTLNETLWQWALYHDLNGLGTEVSAATMEIRDHVCTGLETSAKAVSRRMQPDSPLRSHPVLRSLNLLARCEVAPRIGRLVKLLNVVKSRLNGFVWRAGRSAIEVGNSEPRAGS